MILDTHIHLEWEKPFLLDGSISVSGDVQAAASHLPTLKRVGIEAFRRWDGLRDESRSRNGSFEGQC